MDVVSYNHKIVPASLLHGDKFLGVVCVSVLSREDIYAISPPVIDGTYHSDVASLDSQPSLMQRIEKLPKSFAPRGLEDEDLFTLAVPRSAHDITDIQNMLDYSASQLVSSSDEPTPSADSAPAAEPTPSADPAPSAQ